MIPDPTIDEVRRVRHEISRESGHDLRRMKTAFTALEAQFARPPVDYSGRRTIRCNAAAKPGDKESEAVESPSSPPADQ